MKGYVLITQNDTVDNIFLVVFFCLYKKLTVEPLPFSNHMLFLQDVYETFNILLRRKPKENNFKVSINVIILLSGLHTAPMIQAERIDGDFVCRILRDQTNDDHYWKKSILMTYIHVWSLIGCCSGLNFRVHISTNQRHCTNLCRATYVINMEFFWLIFKLSPVLVFSLDLWKT